MDEHEQALADEIVADARKRADRIAQRARREGDQALDEARTSAEADRETVIAAAARQAEHEVEISGGRIEHEVSLLRLDVQHRMVARVRAEAEGMLAELAGGADHRASLESLALAAIEAMAADRFRLVLRRADRERWGHELAESVRAAVGKRLGRDVLVTVDDEDLEASGGLIVKPNGGHELADQTYEARMARLWGDLRSRLAAMLDAEAAGGAP